MALGFTPSKAPQVGVWSVPELTGLDGRDERGYVDVMDLMKIEEAAESLLCSRAKIYTLIHDGELKHVKIRGSAFVTRQSVEEYIAKVMA